MLSVHVTLFLVGYQAAFDASMNTWHYLFIYLGDFTYLVNTVLYFLTAIKSKGKVIQDKDVIIKQNLNVYFITDVLSLLPLEIFGFASSSVLFTTALLRLNRVLRIIRVTDFLCKWYGVRCIRGYCNFSANVYVLYLPRPRPIQYECNEAETMIY